MVMDEAAAARHAAYKKVSYSKVEKIYKLNNNLFFIISFL